MNKRIFQTIILIFALLFIPFQIGNSEESSKGNISFKPNSIPLVNVNYEDYSFVFSYKSFFIRVRPFIIYNGSYYGMEQIVSWIKNNYPNVNYKWLIDKAEKSIHYGFNLTKLPQNIADKIDYLGFRLVDLNFPLSWFELEKIEVLEIGLEPYNITRIHIPKANLVLSFEDLYPQGYSVKHINSTYVLIGNVKGKTDLIVDPITFSGGIMTMVDFGSSDSWTDNLFWEFWNASYVNNWNVAEKTDSGEDTQFTFGCRLKIGNDTEAGACWVYDTNVQVTFNSTALSANNQHLIEITDYSHLRLGVLQDATNKVTYNGVQIITKDTTINSWTIRGETEAEVKLYSSSFRSTDTGARHKRIGWLPDSIQIYNCEFDNHALLGNAEVYNLDITNTQAYSILYFTGSLDRVTVFYSRATALYLRSDYAFSVKNLIARETQWYFIEASSITTDKYLINVDSDKWTITWVSTSSAEIYRQYEFDLTIFFSNGTQFQNANVTISNDYLGSSTSWLTFANGSIPQQTYSFGHYNQTGANTIYDYNPYNLTVTYDDYSTYSTLFNITRKEDLKITLIPISTVDYSIVFLAIGLSIGICILFAGVKIKS